MQRIAVRSSLLGGLIPQAAPILTHPTSIAGYAGPAQKGEFMSPCQKTRLNPEANPQQNATFDPVVRHNIEANLKAYRPPASQQPGEAVVMGCVFGDEECCAIRDSWRASLPIVELAAEDFDGLVIQNQVVFDGRFADLAEAN